MAHYLVMAEIQKREETEGGDLMSYTTVYPTLWKGHKAVSACALSKQSMKSVCVLVRVCVCVCVHVCVWGAV